MAKNATGLLTADSVPEFTGIQPLSKVDIANGLVKENSRGPLTAWGWPGIS